MFDVLLVENLAEAKAISARRDRYGCWWLGAGVRVFTSNMHPAAFDGLPVRWLTVSEKAHRGQNFDKALASLVRNQRKACANADR